MKKKNYILLMEHLLKFIENDTLNLNYCYKIINKTNLEEFINDFKKNIIKFTDIQCLIIIITCISNNINYFLKNSIEFDFKEININKYKATLNFLINFSKVVKEMNNINNFLNIFKKSIKFKKNITSNQKLGLHTNNLLLKIKNIFDLDSNIGDFCIRLLSSVNLKTTDLVTNTNELIERLNLCVNLLGLRFFRNYKITIISSHDFYYMLDYENKCKYTHYVKNCIIDILSKINYNILKYKKLNNKLFKLIENVLLYIKKEESKEESKNEEINKEQNEELNKEQNEEINKEQNEEQNVEINEESKNEEINKEQNEEQNEEQNKESKKDNINKNNIKSFLLKDLNFTNNIKLKSVIFLDDIYINRIIKSWL